MELELSDSIRSWVRQLGHDIGERNGRNRDTYDRLCRARDLIVAQLGGVAGGVQVLSYEVDGSIYDNIELTLGAAGRDAPSVVVGAHYDTAPRAPGANDNATGVACLLAIARQLREVTLPRPVRLVAFTNEEPPHTRKPTMGSLVYARELAKRSAPACAMMSLETLSATRWLPRMPLFVVGNLRSRRLAHQMTDALRRQGQRLSLSIVAPGFLPAVKSSDHWSFWQQGWPAVMLTAGGPFTYAHYHRSSDTIEHTRHEHLVMTAKACAAVARSQSIGSASSIESARR